MDVNSQFLSRTLAILSLSLFSTWSHARTDTELTSLSFETLEGMSLSELLELDVITPSRTKQRLIDSPANITVITQLQITQRGYNNLVEVLQDIPGFDFSTYEDGGGEYPTHSANRGIGGGPGNPKLLVLLDGVVQNHIAFNWSQLWGEENIFADLDRIEIIQGPGSAAYGANAFSGVIHFITKKQVSMTSSSLDVIAGQDNTRSITFTHHGQFKNININAALKHYTTQGDQGDRYDPQGYFSGHEWPQMQTQAYVDGNYQTDVNHPSAGELMPGGFNTEKNIWALRGNVSYFSPEEENRLQGISKLSAGAYLWDKEEGLASYVPNYEYQSWLDTFKSHHTGKHLYFDLDYRINQNFLSKTRTWYRENRQKPETAFRYTYQFSELTKSYHSFNSQVGLEEQIEWRHNDESALVLGFRVMQSDKMNQIASLGNMQQGHDAITSSSWLHATQGENKRLGAVETQAVDVVNEQALYAIYDSTLSARWNYSLGLRYDKSDDFGSTLNPRVAFIYKMPTKLFEQLNLKFLYGQAFREPSIFELTDEFRGNNELKPEEISTYEVIMQGSWLDDKVSWLDGMSFNASVFYSDMSDLITLVPLDGLNGDSGSVYANTEQHKVLGYSFSSDLRFTSQFKSYVNYHFNEGDNGNGYSGINNSASHKFNLGLNYDSDDCNIDIRMNYVGDRTVHPANGYFEHEAPSYTKFNLKVSGKTFSVSGLNMRPSLQIENLFDTQYYGVGRQDGSSDETEYDVLTNPNPAGFIPAYHPQPGRQIYLKLSVSL